MSIAFDRRWAQECSRRRSGGLPAGLAAAAMAALLSSCAAVDGQTQVTSEYASIEPAAGAEPESPPAVRTLSDDERARFQDFLTKEGYDNVQFVILAFGEGENEELTALQFQETAPLDRVIIDERDFLIPPVQTAFDRAVVAYTGSPARVTSCGPRSGGSRYCDF